MRLTAETFDELIRSLRSNAPAGSEKRRQPRVGLRVRAEVMVRDPATGFGGERAEITIRDISAGGVGLLVPRPIDAGQRFSLVLDGAASRSVRCVVMHCRSVGANLFRIGAKFEDDDAGAEPKK